MEYSTIFLLSQGQDPIVAGCDHRPTVRKLLLHCVQLLKETKYQDIAGHAICLLSDLCLSESKVEYLHENLVTDNENGGLI